MTTKMNHSKKFCVSLPSLIYCNYSYKQYSYERRNAQSETGKSFLLFQ